VKEDGAPHFPSDMTEEIPGAKMFRDRVLIDLGRIGGGKMIPVQEITLKTKKDRRFQTFIENPAKGVYRFCLHCFDKKSNISAGYAPQTMHPTAEGAYEEMFDFVLKYLVGRKDKDSIEYIDNPCNCELIGKVNQRMIVKKFRQSFPVKVNGRR